MMTISKKTILILSMFLMAQWPGLMAAEQEYLLLDVLVEGNANISGKDFGEINKAVVSFLEKLKGKYSGRDYPSYVSVRWFGGKKHYTGTPYFKLTSSVDLELYRAAIADRQHPKYTKTALIESLGKSYIKQVKMIIALPPNYKRSIVCLSFNSDNDSSQDQKAFVKSSADNLKAVVKVLHPGGTLNKKEVAKISTYTSVKGVSGLKKLLNPDLVK